MRARFMWLVCVLVMAQFEAAASPARAENSFPQLVKAWSELACQGPGRPIKDLKLSAGHLTLQLTSGSALPVMAGSEVVGLFFRGDGALEYASVDPIEFPVLAYNARKNTSLEVATEPKRVVIRDTFKEALWLAAGAELPALPAEATGKPLDDALASHLAKFGKAYTSPLCHDFPAWRRNGGNRPLVRAEIAGGSEDLLYVLDAFEVRSEGLAALRKNKQISDRYDLVVLSDQPIGRDRRDPVVPRLVLGDVDLAVTASSGKDLSVTATETFTAVSGRTGVLVLDLYDTIFWRNGMDERHLHVKAITDEAGNTLPFDHRKDELAVGLAAPLVPGASVKLRFELEGDILHSPHGDSYWELGVWPWFPQPDLAGQYYKVHALVKVKKPFVPFAPGKTVRRAEEGEYNVLETRIDKPIQFMVILAGKYSYEEDTKDGVTVRVATYAGKSANLKRVLKLAHQMIAFYEPFLGPFPFDEYNIIEINEWGYGQAPPAFMFITQEAFSPLGGEINRYFSKGINERLAHEIAHQYWGIVAKMPSFEEQWLTESFAEMSAGLLIRAQRGKSDFEGLANYWRGSAKEAAAIAPIPLANRIDNESDTEAAWVARTFLLYAKGPSILNSIRLEIGDDAFLKFLRSCQATFEWKFGSTAWVEQVLESVTKKDWKPFFDAYYWGTAMPAK